MNSPENPTWILGLLGGAAAATPWLRGKLSEWKRRTATDVIDPREVMR